MRRRDGAGRRAFGDDVHAFGDQLHRPRGVVERDDHRVATARCSSGHIDRQHRLAAGAVHERRLPAVEAAGARRRRSTPRAAPRSPARPRRRGTSGRSARMPMRDAGEQPAAAERRDHRIDVRQILDDLQRHRAVAADEVVVVERVHQPAGHAIGPVVLDRPPALVEGRLDDRRAEPLDRRELGLRARCPSPAPHGAPARRAASATPCAALPALTVQTPSASVRGGSWRTALHAPRILNEPIGWSVSSLRYTSGLRRTGRQPDQRCADGGVVDAAGGVRGSCRSKCCRAGQPHDRSRAADPGRVNQIWQLWRAVGEPRFYAFSQCTGARASSRSTAAFDAPAPRSADAEVGAGTWHQLVRQRCSDWPNE